MINPKSLARTIAISTGTAKVSAIFFIGTVPFKDMDSLIVLTKKSLGISSFLANSHASGL